MPIYLDALETSCQQMRRFETYRIEKDEADSEFPGMHIK